MLPRKIQKKIKREKKIIFSKLKVLRATEGSAIGIKSVLDTHKWLLFQDSQNINYFLLVERKICENFEKRIFFKLKSKIQDLIEIRGLKKTHNFFSFEKQEISKFLKNFNQFSLENELSSSIEDSINCKEEF